MAICLNPYCRTPFCPGCEEPMPKFKVIAYDRTVRHFEKVIEAVSAEAARELAEEEEIGPAAGWEERYEELFSEAYIESVEEVEEPPHISPSPLESSPDAAEEWSIDAQIAERQRDEE